MAIKAPPSLRFIKTAPCITMEFSTILRTKTAVESRLILEHGKALTFGDDDQKFGWIKKHAARCGAIGENGVEEIIF